MNLYLHNIWQHFPQEFDSNSFYDSQTDYNESIIAKLKRILKYNTDRKNSNSLKEAFIRSQFIHNESNSQRCAKNKISKEFSNYTYSNIVIEGELFKKERETIEMFLKDIDMRYGSDYVVKQEDNIIFDIQ